MKLSKFVGVALLSLAALCIGFGAVNGAMQGEENPFSLSDYIGGTWMHWVLAPARSAGSLLVARELAGRRKKGDPLVGEQAMSPCVKNMRRK
ncbi:MAG: hypothetical protein ACYC96_11990 [Fimbriimonadaceae bacterium]